MSLFCKHEFKETTDGNSIYCGKCGKVKHLKCQHIFEKDVSGVNSTWLAVKNSAGHTVDTYKRVHLRCKKCGDVIKKDFK